ncbi:MAG TPA: polyprenol monophosphomannose synthase [Vicinamibacterales bacterium]|nr:polyprenol monophosphomannose synthase [Vicinamibacterales bacterium]
MMPMLVVMPTYNERANLETVVAGILAHDFARLLVVDDASPDGTGALADTLARKYPGRLEVMHRTGPRGLGRSYIDGLRHALQTDAQAICQIDADLSHDPAYLPDMAAALAQHDLVIGSRYLHGVSVVNWPLHRIILSAFANQYIRAITGLAPRDCTSAYRVWRRDALAKLPLSTAHTSGYAFLPEMLFEAARLGCRIGEVPIIFVERQKGYSKVSQSVLLESLWTPWQLILRRGRLRSRA